MSRLFDDFKAAVLAVLPTSPFWVPRKFRVVEMTGNRVVLQAVVKALGLPDILPVLIAPGMAGLSAQLPPGSIVVVQFVDGDPSQPVITHFAAPDEQGFLPVSVALNATSTVTIGASASSVVLASGSEVTASYDGRVVRYGDIVFIPALTVSGAATVPLITTVAPAPAPTLVPVSKVQA